MPDRRDMRASHDDRDQVVERLRVAAGDGRLTAEELDERLEAALTARTYGELERLVVDLPAASGGAALAAPGALPAVPVKEVVQLRSRNGNIRRIGPWSVPRRLDVEVRNGNVLLDLTQAVVTHPTLGVTIALRSGNLTLVVPPGVSVDVDNLSVRSGNIRQRVHHDPATAPTLLVNVSGQIRSGNVTVRGPRRGFWARLRRR